MTLKVGDKVKWIKEYGHSRVDIIGTIIAISGNHADVCFPGWKGGNYDPSYTSRISLPKELKNERSCFWNIPIAGDYLEKTNHTLKELIGETE